MEAITREVILDTVRQWSTEEKIAVMEEILQLVKSENQMGGKRAKTLERALEIAANDKAVPDDETVEQWRRERIPPF